MLDGRLAKAARDAGIPQEGLDGLPSSDIRNKFIDSLASTGYISQNTAENIKKTTYNQIAGVGSCDLVNVNTTEGTLTDLIDMVSTQYFDFSDAIIDDTSNQLAFINQTKLLDYSSDYSSHTDAAHKLTFADILNGNYVYWVEGDINRNNMTTKGGITDAICNLSIWDAMFETFEGLLDTGDEYTQAALAYARRMITDMVTNLGADCEQAVEHADIGRVPASDKWNLHNDIGKNIVDNFGDLRAFGDKKPSDGPRDASYDSISADVVGINGIYAHDDNGNNDNDSKRSYTTINISTMFNAYLTYFAQYMEGIGDSSYEVNKTKTSSNLIDDMFVFTMVTDIDTSGDNLLIAAFYDTLFNQICAKGWTENDKVNDNEYLQESLKNGNMYISTLADDGYYYQGNYATNRYIKEITDEEAVAQAEAKYNREKEKLSYKENILDMKMKNLDTEISSLTTEYDTVKSVISKNIEKGFKRYQA